jgi:hypothetical protein
VAPLLFRFLKFLLNPAGPACVFYFFPFACKDFCAMLSKIKRTCFFLFVLSFWEGWPDHVSSSFFIFFFRCVVSWLMLFGYCELWTESQKLKLENLLFKQCSTTFLERIAWLVRCSFIFYFLWSLPTPGHQKERV